MPLATAVALEGIGVFNVWSAWTTFQWISNAVYAEIAIIIFSDSESQVEISGPDIR